MTRWILLFFLPGLLLVLLLFLLPDGDPGAGDPPDGGPRIPVLSPPASPGERGAPLRTVPFGFHAPAPSPLFPVTVVHAVDRSPVAGARVRWMDVSRRTGWQRFLEARQAGGEEDLLGKRGDVLVTDENGRAWTPLFSAAALFMAETEGGRSEVLSFERGTPPDPGEAVELLLRPGSRFTVRVTDAWGRPAAGVPVGVVHEASPKRRFFDMRRTDAAGERRFFVPRGEEPEAGGGTRLVVAIPSLHPPTLPFPVPVESAGVQRITLPPTGSLRVRILDGHGDPFRDSAWVEVRAKELPERVGERLGVWTVLEPAPQGVALIPHVGLGERFRVTVGDVAGLHAPAWAEVEGPADPGIVKDVTFRLGEQRPFVSGRVLLAQGGPAAFARLVVSWRSARVSSSPSGDQDGGEEEDGDAFSGSETVLSDAEGRFRAALGVPAEGDAPLDLRIVALAAGGFREGWMGPRVLVRRDGLGRGENVLGDLVLRRAREVARGEVVDERGHPIPGVRVRLLPPEGEEPSEEEPLETITDRRGGFVVRGPSLLDAFRLLLHREGFRESVTGPYPSPQRGLRLTMSRGASLVFKLLMDSDLPPTSLMVQVEGEPLRRHIARDGWEGADRRWLRVPASGVVRLDGLCPGRLQVRVLCSPTRDLVVIRDIEVPPVGEVSDPRLSALDLRGRVPLAVLDLEDPAGRSPGGLPLVEALSASGRPLPVYREPGRVILAGELPALLRIRSPGFRRVVIRGRPSSGTIRLRRARGFDAVLRLPSLPPSGSGLRLRASLEPDDPGFEPVPGDGPTAESVLVDARGVMRFPVREEGPHHLRLWARVFDAESGTWGAAREFRPGQPVIVDLSAEGKSAEEPLTVPVDARSLEAFLRRL